MKFNFKEDYMEKNLLRTINVTLALKGEYIHPSMKLTAYHENITNTGIGLDGNLLLKCLDCGCSDEDENYKEYCSTIVRHIRCKDEDCNNWAHPDKLYCNAHLIEVKECMLCGDNTQNILEQVCNKNECYEAFMRIKYGENYEEDRRARTKPKLRTNFRY
jgi:hypothetical protein